MAIDPGIYEDLAAFRLALRRFLSFSEAVTAAAGVTAQHYQALLVVRSHAGGRIMIRELAELMLLQPHGAVQLVDRMVAAGIVERNDSPTDGRSVLISLTERGTSILEELAALHIRELMVVEPLLAESLRRLKAIRRDLGPNER